MTNHLTRDWGGPYLLWWSPALGGISDSGEGLSLPYSLAVALRVLKVPKRSSYFFEGFHAVEGCRETFGSRVHGLDRGMACGLGGLSRVLGNRSQLFLVLSDLLL